MNAPTANHLGSAALELNETAEIISYQEYHPFGSTSYELHTNDSEVSLKRYQYVGKERDGESGLYYYGARYYADWLCRFVSVDPLKDDYPYYTTYQYAGNKPITSIDVDGLEAENQVEEEEVGQQDEQDEIKQGGWILRIYSPEISGKFKEAIENDDLFEARRLTFYALNNRFEKPNNVDPASRVFVNDKLKPDSMAATLHYDPEGNGLQVRTYNWGPGRINIFLEPSIYEFQSTTKGWTYDQYFPVDVNLYNFSDGTSTGEEYYGDLDFKAIDIGAGYTFGIGGTSEMTGIFSPFASGSGLIQGYMRGYGFTQLSYKIEGSSGFSLGFHGSRIDGSFQGDRSKMYDGESYSPYSLEGSGLSITGGLKFTTVQTWSSIDPNGEVLFSGTAKGISFSIGFPFSLSGDVSVSTTKVKFPKRKKP